MNGKKKTTTTLAGLLLLAACMSGCASLTESGDYEANRRVTFVSPDGTTTTFEDGVKETKTTTKTEVEEPSWLVELARSVLKLFG